MTEIKYRINKSLGIFDTGLTGIDYTQNMNNLKSYPSLTKLLNTNPLLFDTVNQELFALGYPEKSMELMDRYLSLRSEIVETEGRKPYNVGIDIIRSFYEEEIIASEGNESSDAFVKQRIIEIAKCIVNDSRENQQLSKFWEKVKSEYREEKFRYLTPLFVLILLQHRQKEQSTE